ncbi:MAG TPA: ATP-binding protein [Bacteroidales bacterium]|nr:ATP-binding protein [Bacteroidales bacterium]
MNTNKTGNIAFIISLIITGLFIILFILFNLFFINSFRLYFILLMVVALFSASFFIIKFFLEKFIYEKIKPIYKTIFNLKNQKNKDQNQDEFNKDIISSVNQQVINWAKDKKDEIEELKKMETYRREFLGNVSHELKTPIFNIQGYILTLLDGGLEDPNINREYLLRTEKSIDRMIHIVQDLETISKFESGELIIQKQTFDIVSLVKEVFEFLEINAQKKNIQLIFNQVYEKPIMVKADKEKIRQVLINLIDNSIKYGNSDGKTKISFFDMDENMLIEITDSGIGVVQQDIPRLFERFYRTDKGRSREQGGTGLGLAIVKHIIEAHRQTINVRSKIGVGTTFAFTLKKG